MAPITIDMDINTVYGVHTSGQRSASLDSNGRLYAVYVKQSGGDDNLIRLAYSDDKGQNWTKETVYTHLTQWVRGPSLCVDNADRVHIIFYSFDDIILYVRRNADGSYEAPVTVVSIAGSGNPTEYPTIGYYDGKVHVVIFTKDGGVWGAHSFGSAYYTNNVDYTWPHTAGNAPYMVSDAGANAQSCNFAIGTDGTLHVAWLGRPTSGYYHLYYKRKQHGGSWEAQEEIRNPVGSANAEGTTSSFLVVDKTDQTVHCAFAEKSPFVSPLQWQVCHISRPFSGSWGALTQLSTSNNSNSWMSISINDLRDLYVAWMGRGYGANPTIYNIKYIRYNYSGASWGSVISLSDKPDQNRSPNMFSDQWHYFATGWAVIWEDRTGTDSIVWDGVYSFIPPSPPNIVEKTVYIDKILNMEVEL